MANRNWLSVVIIGFMVLSGCGKKAAPFTPISAKPPQAQTEPAPLTAQVSCANDDCESTLALALTLEPNAGAKPIACSATLVANDLIAIPSACLPADIREPGKSCLNRAFFFFPKTSDADAVRVGCTQVVEVRTTPQLNEADFAIVRISDSAKRSALRLSNDGWTSSSYTVWSLEVQDATKSPIQAVQKKTFGTPAFKTALTPTSTKQDSAVMSLIKTGTEKSLPGAIALNSAGDVIGILRNATVTKLPYDQFEREFQPLAIGSLLGCSSTLVGLTADSCQTIATGSIELFTQSLRESAYESFSPQLLKQSQPIFSDEIKTLFQWKTFAQSSVDSSGKKRVFIVPTCFQPEKLWSYKFKQFWGGLKTSATVTQEVPVYTVSEGLNRYYQPEVRMGNHHVSTVNLNIEFSPANFVKTKSSEVIVYTDSRIKPLEKSTLRACTSL